MRARVDHVREFHFVDAVGVKGIPLTCNGVSSVKSKFMFRKVAQLREYNPRCSVYSFKDFEKLSVVSIVEEQSQG